MSFRFAAAAAMLGLLPILAAPAAAQEGKAIELADGLKYTEVKIGDGQDAQKGFLVAVQYTGWLYKNGARGAKFDSSLDRNDPFSFPVGGGQVIQGWDQGVAGMQVGGKRQLVIPAELGYGSRGAGGVIPPNATLLFDVELLSIR